MGCGGHAVVEEGGDYLDVVCWARETTCASTVVDGGDFGRGSEERASVGVIAGSDVLLAIGTGGLLVHVG